MNLGDEGALWALNTEGLASSVSVSSNLRSTLNLPSLGVNEEELQLVNQCANCSLDSYQDILLIDKLKRVAIDTTTHNRPSIFAGFVC